MCCNKRTMLIACWICPKYRELLSPLLQFSVFSFSWTSRMVLVSDHVADEIVILASCQPISVWNLISLQLAIEVTVWPRPCLVCWFGFFFFPSYLLTTYSQRWLGYVCFTWEAFTPFWVSGCEFLTAMNLYSIVKKAAKLCIKNLAKINAIKWTVLINILMAYKNFRMFFSFSSNIFIALYWDKYTYIQMHTDTR